MTELEIDLNKKKTKKEFLNKDSYTYEEVFDFIKNNKLRDDSWDIIVSKSIDLKEFLNSGLTKNDILYSIRHLNEKPHAFFCSICGKQIHSTLDGAKLPRYCSKNCVNEHNKSIYELKEFEFLLDKNYIPTEKDLKEYCLTNGYRRSNFEEYFKRSGLNKTIDQRLTISDVIFNFRHNLEQNPYFCPICGKQIHANNSANHRNVYCCIDCYRIAQKKSVGGLSISIDIYKENKIHKTKDKNLSQKQLTTVRRNIKKEFLSLDRDLTLDEFKDFIDKIGYRAIKDEFYHDVFLKCKETRIAIEEGLTRDDIITSLIKEGEIKHHYCPVCGKEVHVIKGHFRITCSRKCAKAHSHKKVILSLIDRIPDKDLSIEDIKFILKDLNSKQYFSEFIDALFNSSSIVKQYLLDGMSKRDVLYCIEHNKDLYVRKCKVCGEIIHVAESNHLCVGFPDTCCLTCSSRYSNFEKEKIELEELGVDVTNLSFVPFGYSKLLKHEYFKPDFPIQEWRGYDDLEYEYKWKCVPCGEIYTSSIGLSGYPLRHKKCFGRCFSTPEEEILEFTKSIVPDCTVLKNDRKTITPNELDCFVVEKKIAFEMNGVYWHSVKIHDKNYHKEKSSMCFEKGIRLVHIYEDLWLSNKDVVLRFIKTILSENENDDKDLSFKKISFNKGIEVLHDLSIEWIDNKINKKDVFITNKTKNYLLVIEINRDTQNHEVKFCSNPYDLKSFSCALKTLRNIKGKLSFLHNNDIGLVDNSFFEEIGFLFKKDCSPASTFRNLRDFRQNMSPEEFDNAKNILKSPFHEVFNSGFKLFEKIL